MDEGIVFENAPVTLVGGGSAPARDVTEALCHAPVCVAVDGGLAAALAAGAAPVAVVGDFDSVAAADLARAPDAAQHKVAEQDTTDFEKALARVRAPWLIGVGFTGARVDHTLAALHALVAHDGPACALLAEDEVLFHCPPALALPTEAGDVVSLFPLQRVTGRSEGLEWPIDGQKLAPGARIGTSNRALGPVSLHVDGPGLIGIIPRARWAALMPVLARAPRHGPRPAP
ncbi:MAG: thiamine diphosphokinase [Pseudomonadota bacterium]